MQNNLLFNLFDKKKFYFVLRIILILLFFIVAINLISITYSRYESKANTNAISNVAFFVVDEGVYNNSISLSGLTPSDKPYIYTFSISNFNENNERTNVNLEYTVSFATTTNLPLSFEIIRNETYQVGAKNIITKDELIQDANGMYYRNLANEEIYSFGYAKNQTDNYTLVVNFPLQYSENPDFYQSLIDLFDIVINAKQVV